MRWLRFPILGGQDDPDKKTEAPPAVVSREEHDALAAELREERSARKKVEKLLLDPSYVEFVTTGGRGQGRAEQPPPARREESAVDIDQLDNKGLVAHILAEVKKEIRGAVQPVAEDAVIQQSAQLINDTAAKNPDFWEYRETLEKIAKVYPSMHPDHAYLMAKVMESPELLAQIRQHRRRAPESESESERRREAPSRSEPPTNREPRERLPAKITTADAFKIAWKKHAGNRETL